MARSRRSLSLPIVLAAIAVALSITLLVFWLLIVVRDYELGTQVSDNTWLIVLGSVAFAFIMTVLVLFAVFLVQESREVRRQDRFIDSVTHELKSPLASIRLCLETLGRSGVAHKQREDLRQMALTDVRRLHDFIDDILAASRLSHERAGHDVVEVALAELIAQVTERAARRHNETADVVHVDVPDTLTFHTDAVALETVLLNLIDNAIKYSDAPRRVEVRGRVKKGTLTVTIVDHGIGIPQAHLTQIFLRFHRVPLPSVRQRRGTGLGLYVVSALVENLKGRLRAHSDGPGQGTTITLTIPVTIPAASESDAAADELWGEPANDTAAHDLSAKVSERDADDRSATEVR
ncbi:MAG: HAMP domain-containing histidine kinase [Myxococcales bacterium]|nr:HAMP domain-containing histidine kinase [Myxococcales bacterium]